MIQLNGQKVFSTCPRGRKIMVIGSQDYTSPSSGSFQCGWGSVQNFSWCLVPDRFVMENCSRCKLQGPKETRAPWQQSRVIGAACRNMPDAGCLVSIPW